MICDDCIDAVGSTPLIRLHAASRLSGCDILGKAEFMNPSGSVKDRAAKAIIEDAEAKKLLDKGGIVVEGTAGNTGIGLTLIGNRRGYRTVIVIPETQSQEKKDILRLIGAELHEVPAVPYKDANNYVKVSARMAEELAKSHVGGAIWANQFDNTANMMGHYRTTGVEIYQQTDGKIDAFICAVGTGGTLAGVAQRLREYNKNIRIGIADPEGAALYSYYRTGVLESHGSSISEGIGQGRITENLAGLEVDFACQIADSIALPLLFDLLMHEGLYLGASSAINIAGAIAMAKDMGPGHTIVTVLCDSGDRYRSKLYNPAFLRQKGLPCPGWLE